MSRRGFESGCIAVEVKGVKKCSYLTHNVLLWQSYHSQIALSTSIKLGQVRSETSKTEGTPLPEVMDAFYLRNSRGHASVVIIGVICIAK